MSAGRDKNSRSAERIAARKKARVEWFDHRSEVRAKKRSRRKQSRSAHKP